MERPLLSTHTETMGHTRAGVYQIPAFYSLLKQQLGKTSGVTFAGEETYVRVEQS